MYNMTFTENQFINWSLISSVKLIIESEIPSLVVNM